jgi:uncharacterized cupin superfamily protein
VELRTAPRLAERDAYGRKGLNVSTETKSTLKIDDPSAAALQLEAWGAIGSAIDGPMETRGIEMWRGAGERVGTGIWECDAGRFKARFADRGEFIHIVTGRMTCTAEDGTVTELAAGDSMTFPPGWTGEWHVHEPLRKLYCEFKAE